MTNSFYQTYHELIYFIYGLAFFSMGIAVGVSTRRYSTFALATDLWALAIFGISYGLTEWLDVVIPTYIDGSLVEYVTLFEIILTSLSFTFLFHFGIGLVLNSGQRNKYLMIPWGLYGLWLIIFFITYFYFGIASLNRWYIIALTWSRYILVLPGSVLTAYGLYIQAQMLRPFGGKSLEFDLRAAGIVFVGFGIFAGVVTDYAPFFPASVINKSVFVAKTGVPVEIIRAICAVAIAIFSIRILRIFEIEQAHLTREMERTKASFNEREKIRQELHDGIIQSIYAVGLRLACASRVLEKESPAKHHVEASISSLNQVILELREYLGRLKLGAFSWAEIRSGLEEIAKEMKETQGVVVTIELDEGGDVLTDYQINLIFRICKEALHNVLKHAQATEAKVKFISKGEAVFSLEICDNGVGIAEFSPMNSEGNGLKLIRDRVTALGGKLNMENACGKGTVIRILIPKILQQT